MLGRLPGGGSLSSGFWQHEQLLADGEGQGFCVCQVWVMECPADAGSRSGRSWGAGGGCQVHGQSHGLAPEWHVVFRFGGAWSQAGGFAGSQEMNGNSPALFKQHGIQSWGRFLVARRMVGGGGRLEVRGPVEVGCPCERGRWPWDGRICVCLWLLRSLFTHSSILTARSWSACPGQA